MRRMFVRCPACPVFLIEPGERRPPSGPDPCGLRLDIGLILARHVGKAHPQLLESDGERYRRQMVNRLEARRN